MKLVPDARKAWRWFSVQSMVIASAVQGGWLMVPDDLRLLVPGWMATAITIAILSLGVVGRLVDQDATDADQT